ncbi:hypothetical protein BS47DRAFT_1389402 [Hydnum rufescens UP504]|uniref:Uncharacterized protein n=1 Tax=Hydnum rufescens UP504 TaxID=1448309 RepID=A0A9P6B567_9AGAM|nr:hypothetical protein BS47DRAFT_1389402 [Hydnum rufescens UP504]
MDTTNFSKRDVLDTDSDRSSNQPGPSIPLSLETHKRTNERWEDIVTPLVSLCVLPSCVMGELVWLEMNGGRGHVRLESRFRGYDSIYVDRVDGLAVDCFLLERLVITPLGASPTTSAFGNLEQGRLGRVVGAVDTEGLTESCEDDGNEVELCL